LVVQKGPNALSDKQIVVRDHRSEAHEFVPYAERVDDRRGRERSSA
jgi:hypothetical protein